MNFSEDHLRENNTNQTQKERNIVQNHNSNKDIQNDNDDKKNQKNKKKFDRNVNYGYLSPEECQITPDQISLINQLINYGTVKDSSVESVLKSIDKKHFVQSRNYVTYLDTPQDIGYNATISAPHMHATALELLKDHLAKAKNVLDVGAGSGYLTLAFTKMLKNEDAQVYGIEHIQDLVDFALKNISKCHQNYLDFQKVQIFQGDGRLGLKKYGPYDVIHVGAAADKIPEALINQLALGGRMLIPVGKKNDSQDFLIIDKDMQGNITSKSAFQVRYIPLTDQNSQLNKR